MQAVLEQMVKKNILTSLHSGVTTLRSMGEVSYRDLANKARIEAGKYVGPRVLACGYGVTVHAGHTDGLMGIPCETPEQCRRVIADDAAHHADWIKIFVTGGVFDAEVKGEPGVVRMSYELATASCHEAHRLGYRVASPYGKYRRRAHRAESRRGYHRARSPYGPGDHRPVQSPSGGGHLHHFTGGRHREAARRADQNDGGQPVQRGGGHGSHHRKRKTGAGHDIP